MSRVNEVTMGLKLTFCSRCVKHVAARNTGNSWSDNRLNCDYNRSSQKNTFYTNLLLNARSLRKETFLTTCDYGHLVILIFLWIEEWLGVDKNTQHPILQIQGPVISK